VTPQGNATKLLSFFVRRFSQFHRSAACGSTSGPLHQYRGQEVTAAVFRQWHVRSAPTLIEVQLVESQQHTAKAQRHLRGIAHVNQQIYQLSTSACPAIYQYQPRLFIAGVFRGDLSYQHDRQ